MVVVNFKKNQGVGQLMSERRQLLLENVFCQSTLAWDRLSLRAFFTPPTRNTKRAQAKSRLYDWIMHIMKQWLKC